MFRGKGRMHEYRRDDRDCGAHGRARDHAHGDRAHVIMHVRGHGYHLSQRLRLHRLLRSTSAGHRLI